MSTHLALHSASLRLHQIRRHGIGGIAATASDEILQVVILRGGRRWRGGGGGGGRGRASDRVLVIVQKIRDGRGKGGEAETGEGGACDDGDGVDWKGRNRYDKGVN